MRLEVTVPGKILAFLFLCWFLIPATHSFPETQLLSSGPGGFSLSCAPNGFGEDSLAVNGKIYIRFTAGGYDISGMPGTPSLPLQPLIFAAPSGSVPSLSFTTLSGHSRHGVTVAPQPVFISGAGGISVEKYAEDATAYAMSGFQPSSFVSLGESHETTGFTLWELIVTPVLFDAHAATASFADSLLITVSWNGQLTPVKRASRVPAYILNRDEVISTAASALKISGAAENPFATGDWYKISLSDSGMYAVSGTELSTAGLAMGTVPTSSLRLYYGGGKILSTTLSTPATGDFREVAMTVRDTGGDGYFDAGDSLIFYGESLSRFIHASSGLSMSFQNHPYSTTNAYWLTVSSEGTPSRITVYTDEPDSALSLRTTYRERVHTEPDTVSEYTNSGINWGWKTLTGITSTSWSFNAPGIVSGDSARVRVGFLNPGSTTSYLQFRINTAGTYSRNVYYSTSPMEFALSYPGTFTEEGNTLTISRTGGTLNASILLDWVDIEYDRTLTYRSGPMEFFMRGYGISERIRFSGATTSAIEIYNTTDPCAVTRHAGMVYSSAAQTLIFQSTLPGAAYARFTVCPAGTYLKAASIEKKADSDLRNPLNGANYILISPKTFITQAKKLTEWRAHDSATDPLTAKTVDLQDIFDEFAWGVYDPVAIRDYLYYLWENAGEDLRYCCIMGDATYKYKHISASQTGKTWVPTYTAKDVTTDDFFTWFDTTSRPSIAIGRFCVNSVEEAKVAVEKTIAYEQNPESGAWRNRALLIADDETQYDNAASQQTEFSNAVQKFDDGTFIPRTIERSKLMMIEYPLVNRVKPAATEELLARFNEGALISTFFGHGSPDLLAHEHILVGTRDIASFNNEGRLPFFFIGSCNVGRFDLTDFTSLAEKLHLRQGGGCIAVIASSRESTTGTNEAFCIKMYPALFDRETNPESRTGAAVCTAKQSPSVTSDAARLLILFGDPAQRIATPHYTVSVAERDTLQRLSRIDLNGDVLDDSVKTSLSGTLYITARGPVIHKRYLMSLGKAYINYTQPGKIFYQASIPISGSQFSSSLVVPKDIVSDSTDSCIRFFVDGGANGAAGMLDKLAIGDIDPGAPDDTAGPEITLAFDGEEFSDGAIVARKPALTVTVTDSSGINIYGNRGHNVTATIDDTDVYVLTGEMQFSGGYTTASAEYSLPQLSTGAHTISVAAYDSYNNVSKLTGTLTVAGTETGDISITDLLNYPNPMRSGVTTFTFLLNDDAGAANIKVFSQSGRLVETLRFNALNGFNMVEWKPTRELANGVYFYKLTVRSQNGRKTSKIEKLIVMR